MIFVSFLSVGCKPAGLLPAETLFNMYHPAERAFNHKILASRFARGPSASDLNCSLFRVMRPDGSWRWVLGAAIMDEVLVPPSTPNESPQRRL